jgi:O-antigen/teichoic acid export membrane protein
MTAALQGGSRRLFKNSVSQIAGRLLLSLGRMVVALMIGRLAGTDMFGAYALIISFLVFFEWLVDFGQTDIGVRDICQQPEREGAILRALVWLKLIQGVAYFLLLPVLLIVMRYPPEIVRAGAVGAIGLLFYGGVQIFRTVFKVRMCMERDILAELGGLAVALPLTWLACRQHAGIEVLVGCYMSSRVVFLGLVVWFGRGEPRPLGSPVSRRDVWSLFTQSLPLGLSGLLVALYDSLAIIILSKLTDLHAEAQYAAATRFVYPVIIIVQALNSAFYPPLSAMWKSSPARFKVLQQTVLDISLLVGGALFCAINSGADFLMGLMGPTIGEAAIILRILSCVVLARALTAAMSPLIIVAGSQGKTLWLSGTAVLLEATAFLILTPRYGNLGAALGYLFIELALGAGPVSWVGQHVSRTNMHWRAPIKLVSCALASAGLCRLLPGAGTIWSGMLSFALYVPLTLLVGGISFAQLRGLVQELTGRAARSAGVSAPVLEQGRI